MQLLKMFTGTQATTLVFKCSVKYIQKLDGWGVVSALQALVLSAAVMNL